MRRKILGKKAEFGFTSPQVSKSSASSLSKFELNKALRKKRSHEYIESLTKLDAGDYKSNSDAFNKLVESVKSELPDISDLLLGIVAKCYLGHPFEVHTLQIMGDIVHHYKLGEALPNNLEKARSLALHPSYKFIEVYRNHLVAVSSNGSTSLVNLEEDQRNA